MPGAVLPPPFGVPSGPRYEAEELLRLYIGGADAGSSADGEYRIEGGVLMAAALVPLGVRISREAFLVREDVPFDVEALRERLEEALSEDGAGLLEEDSPLGQVVGIEETGQRGAIWNLWGRDRDEALEALKHRAAGEFVGHIEERAAETARMERTLKELEREFER